MAKNSGVLKESHTSNDKKGMGDYYGTGIKARVGEMRGDSLGYTKVSKKGLKVPPKKVA